MPRVRQNSRSNDLARVSPDKAEEDDFLKSSPLLGYNYFTEEQRQACKVFLDQSNRWIYQNGKTVPDGKYLYAVGPNGALYVGNPTVHSQFKAGKPIQSAGHIEYDWSEKDEKANVVIDNNSGHYTPSFSQFMITIYGLNKVNILPDEFKLKLNKFSKPNMEFDTSFFSEEIQNMQSTSEASNTILVNFSYERGQKDIIFSNMQKETYKVSGDIFEKYPSSVLKDKLNADIENFNNSNVKKEENQLR